MALCWLIGLLALSTDEISNYDTRFFFRGDQNASDKIVIVTVVKNELTGAYALRTQYRGDYDQITDFTDSFFWNQELWEKLLTNILRSEPLSVGVALYFGDNIGKVDSSLQTTSIFQDPRIIWSTSTNHLEEVLAPAFTNRERTNIASSEVPRDEDGIVRRIFNDSTDLPHLAEKITGKEFPQISAGNLLNYRGTTKVFKHVTSSEVIYDDLSDDIFRGKIVIIGAETSAGPLFQTPHGVFNRAEIIAHIADNLIENRWIKRGNFFAYAGIFLGLTFIAVFLITTYPQSVALGFIFWLSALIAALSAWSFDSFNIWFPAFSPFILFTATWVVFIGYQATQIERQHHRLQQEQKALQELEQLKNNFVSLISHDLKTPIAKIQAIVGRLSRNSIDAAMQADFKSLQQSSEELNKYIQSIINLLRVESRDFKLHKEVSDINEVIEEVLQQLSPLAVEKNIRIKTDLEPLFSLEFDLTLIKEVVLNLVENAIKYTAPEGQITVTSREKDDFVTVEIKDTGEGIHADDLDKVWGKFTRGSDQDMRSKGTGLGLYLVKYFIELHGGQVHLTSELGVGTVVSFSLPLETLEGSDNQEEL